MNTRQPRAYWKRFKSPIARKEISRLHRKIRALENEIEWAKDSNARMYALQEIIWESDRRIASHDLTSEQVQRIANILYS